MTGPLPFQVPEACCPWGISVVEDYCNAPRVAAMFNSESRTVPVQVVQDILQPYATNTSFSSIWYYGSELIDSICPKLRLLGDLLE